ncbi:MAG: Scr1 family TA system antitoxin-like transcriptional regulator [Pseudonocardiaceae bacterium]
MDAAGKRSGPSGPTISHIENGKRGVTVDEVEHLLDAYQVPLPQQREYLEMAERGWWQAYGSQLTDATTQPNVTILVIPFTAGAHAAVEGSFAIMEFGLDPGAVLLEGKTADLFLEEDHGLPGHRT